MCPEQTTPAWCDKCNKFRPTLQQKRLQTLPHILALNCGMEDSNVILKKKINPGLFHSSATLIFYIIIK